MKTPAIIALGGFLLATIAAAQQVNGASNIEQEIVWRSLPEFRAETTPSPDTQPVIDILDVRLVPHLSSPDTRRNIADFAFLKSPMGYLDGGRLDRLKAAYQESTAGLSDTFEISWVVLHEVREHPDLVCETVEREIRMHPKCACEIVKAALIASEADDDLAVQITERAIIASPEHMRITTQCAIAQAPGATQQILALLARLDPHAGETPTSAKGAKVSMILSQAAPPPQDESNPLDRLFLAVATPDPIIPPPVSAVDP